VTEVSCNLEICHRFLRLIFVPIYSYARCQHKVILKDFNKFHVECCDWILLKSLDYLRVGFMIVVFVIFFDVNFIRSSDSRRFHKFKIINN
jgi:hypothetical protein